MSVSDNIQYDIFTLGATSYTLFTLSIEEDNIFCADTRSVLQLNVSVSLKHSNIL